MWRDGCAAPPPNKACPPNPPSPSRTHLKLRDLGLQLPHLRLLGGAQLAQQRRANLRLRLSDACLHMVGWAGTCVGPCKL